MKLFAYNSVTTVGYTLCSSAEPCSDLGMCFDPTEWPIISVLCVHVINLPLSLCIPLQNVSYFHSWNNLAQKQHRHFSRQLPIQAFVITGNRRGACVKSPQFKKLFVPFGSAGATVSSRPFRVTPCSAIARSIASGLRKVICPNPRNAFVFLSVAKRILFTSPHPKGGEDKKDNSGTTTLEYVEKCIFVCIHCHVSDKYRQR